MSLVQRCGLDLGGTTERLGDALMQAQRRLHEHGSLYEDAVGSAMLLGDPAMRLR